MSQPDKGFGGRLFDKVAKERGISKSRIYKILALQRLCDEVKKLGDEGKVRESALLELSKIETPARQKLLADLVIARNLTVDQVRELAKLIRAAEKAPPDQASDLWDQFFELKDAIESKGMTESISKKVHQVAVAVDVPEKATDEEEAELDPELRKALGFPEQVECTTGRGLDVGTTNIVSSGRTLEGNIHFVLQRNAFLDVRNDSFTKRMLIKLGIDHVMHESRMYVIGDPAFELANIFEKETRRPMKDGLISPLESESLQMISMVIHQVLGNPREPGELVYYCVPADPIDADRNVIYHRGALETVLRRQGFTPKSIIEGHSVVMSELEAEDYTGIGVSCGGGMFNVCIAYKSVPALTFSTSRGGDWVDINVGKALGIPASQATAIKESGVDLTHPRNRQEEAICIYYRELIHYTLATMQRQLETVRDLPAFSHPVELVCAGGTSLIRGFIQVFEEEYQKVLFPIEVKRIRLARDPLRSVATGCLAAAQEEMAIRTGAKKETDAPTLLGGGRVASVSGEVVAKPKDARGLPRKKNGEDDNVKILHGLKKLNRSEDPTAGGRASVEQKIVSLPSVPTKSKRSDTGPEAHVVSMPKAKDAGACRGRRGRRLLLRASGRPGRLDARRPPRLGGCRGAARGTCRLDARRPRGRSRRGHARPGRGPDAPARLRTRRR
jgi:actin-like ATPase involved in cell morphogenesis